MLRRIVSIVVVVSAVACGLATPQEEARAFIVSLAECIDANREAMRESFASGEPATTEQMDAMCGDVDRDALSDEAAPLVEEAGRAAFAKALQTIMEAAMASAFAGGEGSDRAAVTGAVDALVDAFTDAVTGAVDPLVDAFTDAAESIQP